MNLSQRRVRRSFLALGTVIVTGAFASTASAKPTLTFNLASQGDAGKATPYSYSTFGVKKADRLVVQRQVGTAHRWTTVKKLTNKKSGSGQLPALTLGTYKVRLAEIGKRSAVRIQRVKSLAVFGNVPFATIWSGGSTHSISIPNRTFTYAGAFDSTSFNDDDRFQATIDGGSNDCRSIHLDFVSHDGFTTSDAPSETISVTQETRDPQSTSAPYDVLGGFDFSIVPGQAWTLAVNPSGIDESVVYFNGTASCLSAHPIHQ